MDHPDMTEPVTDHVPTPAGHVLMVCSSGGHLAQLLDLGRLWERDRRSWVTFDTTDAVSQLQGEDVVWAHHPTTRNLPNLMRNFRLALREVRGRRPDVVVSTGAAVALPFFIVSRALRIPTVYIEVYDRLDGPTLTGRLCRPFTTTFCVQWPEQQRYYRDSVLVGALL
jgi:UDP-N-acetylglucosamine:LPS N-acetylglucosamine transferase